jgi:hypothetical protein
MEGHLWGSFFIALCLLAQIQSGARGEGIVVARKITIPEGQEYVDLPAFSISSDKVRTGIGYGIYFESWSSKFYLCRIHLNQKTDRIAKGTLIVFDGTHEIEKTVHGTFAHKFFVKEPKEIGYISCGAYVNHYRSLMGENAKLVGRSFPEDYR